MDNNKIFPFSKEIAKELCDSIILGLEEVQQHQPESLEEFQELTWSYVIKKVEKYLLRTAEFKDVWKLPIFEDFLKKILIMTDQLCYMEPIHHLGD